MSELLNLPHPSVYNHPKIWEMNFLRYIFPKSWFHPQKLPVPDEIIREALKNFNMHVPTEYIYPDHGLVYAIKKVTSQAGQTLWKSYAIVHLASFLLFKRKKFKKKPFRTLLRSFISFCRSLLFMSGIGFIWCGAYTTITDPSLTPKQALAITLFFKSIAPFTILIEKRRAELAMNVFPKLLESWLTFFRKMRLIPLSIPLGSVRFLTKLILPKLPILGVLGV